MGRRYLDWRVSSTMQNLHLKTRSSVRAGSVER